MSNKFKEVKKQYWKRRYKEFTNKVKPAKNTKNLNQPPLDMTEKIALIIDGEVVDIISCQPRLAAILLSEPLIIDASNKDIMRGFKYEDGKFINPHDDQNEHHHHHHHDENK